MLNCAAMRVVVVLRVTVVIKDIVAWVVLKFDKLTLTAQNFTDDIKTATPQHPPTFQHLFCGDAHGSQLIISQAVQPRDMKLRHAHPGRS